MLSIPKYPEQYAQHFPAIFYLLCCAFQHHVVPAALRHTLVLDVTMIVIYYLTAYMVLSGVL